MKIIFAGTSHGIPEKNRFCASTFLVVNGKVYIIDAGAPISPLLLNYDLRHRDVQGIFITHHHGDHFYGLLEFCSCISWYYKDSSPAIFLPEERGVELIQTVVENLRLQFEKTLDLRLYDDGPIYQDENIEVTAVPTRHIPHAHAFRIKAEGKNLLFTGDMSWNYPEFAEVHGNQHYDLIVSECAHCETLPSRADILRTADTDRLILNHINPVKLEGMETMSFPFEFTASNDGEIVTL